MARKRLNASLSDGEYRATVRRLRRMYPYLKPTTALSVMLRELAENKLQISYVGTTGTTGTKQFQNPVPLVPSGTTGTGPDPARARVIGSSGKKKEEIKKERRNPSLSAGVNIGDLYGSLCEIIRRNAGIELNPCDTAAHAHIFARLNGTAHPPAATVKDIVLVVEWQSREWAGTRFAKHLNMATLLGDKFWFKHAAAKAPPPAKEPESMSYTEQRRHREQIEAKKREAEDRLAEQSRLNAAQAAKKRKGRT